MHTQVALLENKVHSLITKPDYASSLTDDSLTFVSGIAKFHQIHHLATAQVLGSQPSEVQNLAALHMVQIDVPECVIFMRPVRVSGSCPEPARTPHLRVAWMTRI